MAASAIPSRPPAAAPRVQSSAGRTALAQPVRSVPSQQPAQPLTGPLVPTQPAPATPEQHVVSTPWAGDVQQSLHASRAPVVHSSSGALSPVSFVQSVNASLGDMSVSSSSPPRLKSDAIRAFETLFSLHSPTDSPFASPVYCIEQETPTDFVSVTAPYVNSLSKRPRQWIASLIRRGEQRSTDGEKLFAVVGVFDSFCLVTRSPPAQAVFPNGVVMENLDGTTTQLDDAPVQEQVARLGRPGPMRTNAASPFSTGEKIVAEAAEHAHIIALPLRLDLFSARDLRPEDAGLLQAMVQGGRSRMAQLLRCSEEDISVYGLRHRVSMH